MTVEVVKESGKGRLPVEFIGTLAEMRALALDSTTPKVVGDIFYVEDINLKQITGKYQWNDEAWNAFNSPVVITEGNVIGPKESVFGDNIVASRVAQITGNFYFGIESEAATITGPVGTAGVDLVGNPGFENLLRAFTGTTAGSDVTIENNSSMRYIPGFELGAYITTVFTPPTGDGIAEAGLTDLGQNGFFIGFREVEGAQTFGFGKVKDGVEVFVPQADFNYDKLDGNGPSGITVDHTKGNIWRVRFGYLGFASPVVEYITPQNKVKLVHIFEYPNANTETHVSSTYLSPYLKVDNGTTAENVDVKIGSLCVYLVDGSNIGVNDRNFSYGTNATLTGAAGYARRLLIDFYNSGSFQGNLMPSAKAHKIPALLQYLSLTLSGQNKPILLEIIAVPDADMSGGTYIKASPDSILDIATDSTVTTFTNSSVLFTGTFISPTSKIEPLLDKLKLKLRPGFHAVFALTSDTVQDIDYAFANAWAEEF